MNVTELIFWGLIMLPLVVRATIDNVKIQRDYMVMSEELVPGITISLETAKSFKGFFKWCARTHQFMIYMIFSHTLYFFIHGGSTPEAIVITFELMVMSLIHYPQQIFTRKVLQNFFQSDIPKLENMIDSIEFKHDG